jgi:uncharacterized membrane protein YphA (DoxX/SURF4 family)
MKQLQRFGLRFACLWVLLGTIGMLFGLTGQYAVYAGLWGLVVPAVGHGVLGIDTEIVPRMTGSGDYMFAWVQTLCEICLSAVGAMVWTALDRQARHDARLAEILRVTVRYSLAWIMLGYGIVKVFKTQFPFPGGERLLQPYGESSPMGLLWTFMGYSTAYNVFTGGLELFGAVLLLFRRTTTLGALVLAGVLSNVLMLNICYDVPVKLFSMQLLALSLLLLAKDAPRLLAFLVQNRATAPAVIAAPLPWPRLERARPFLKGLLVCGMLYKTVANGFEYRRQWGPEAPEPPHFGVWEVESFTADGAVHPPLTTDAERWRAVSITRNGRFIVVSMSGGWQRFNLTQSEDGGTFTLKSIQDPSQEWSLAVTRREQTELGLAGRVGERDLVVVLRRRELGEFPLVSRGFHWVNEFPNNR